MRLRPDLILFGGKVLTVDPAFSIAEALAVSDDRIVAVGASADIRRLADGVVLSDDPLTCAEARIKDITAELTIVGGRAVHPQSLISS